MERGTGIIKIILVTAAIALMTGCRHDIVWSHHEEFGHEGWHRNHQTRFVAAVDDTSAITSVDIILRTGSGYPYRNIWLFVSAYAPGGETRRDTIEYFVADEKGNRYGRGAGDIRELELTYRKNVFFAEKGQYVFVIEHGMRNDTLPGIYDIGIRIREEKERPGR